MLASECAITKANLTHILNGSLCRRKLNLIVSSGSVGRFQESEFNDSFRAMNLKSERAPSDPKRKLKNYLEGLVTIPKQTAKSKGDLNVGKVEQP